MDPSTHLTVDGTLLWADEQGFVYALQTSRSNGLIYLSFVKADEATLDDEKDCNTIIVEAFPHIDDYNLIPL